MQDKAGSDPTSKVCTSRVKGDTSHGENFGATCEAKEIQRH